ncbi:glucose dehydrogenase [FAD, quinone]-like isoform X1 [Centruroides vittatus]|uniref:glucose dehydrogenase [FAD, quinone]-like isoform X1 n=1 Tax=Centruroides vittatus TaxID=120091 RepID=UPI0035100D4A
MDRFLLVIAIIIVNGVTSNSEFVTEVNDFYDYIIIGGGTAGSLLANRLSSNSSLQILLLEAGSIPDEIANIPLAVAFLQKTEFDWSYKSVPQKHSCFGLKENRSSIPRGKALGGSSTINFMLYVRGTEKDYDNWAANGAIGWSWKEVFPYFTKWENNQDSSIVSNGYHGVGGEMNISRTKYYTPLAYAYVDAAKELGHKEGDYNGPDPETFMLNQGYITNGRRCNAYDAFVRPIYKRKNLHIAVEALVIKILFDTHKRAIGVQFEHKNKVKESRVTREVILSAGAINSPQILMLSGIGPKEHLQKMGIPVVSDLPVGKNLQDHVTVGLPFTVEKVVTYNIVESIILGILPYFIKEGPLTGLITETIGFISTKYNNQSKWPDIELMFSSATPSSDNGLIIKNVFGITEELWEKVFQPNTGISSFFCFPLLMRPESVGEIKLASTDPHQPPIINPNYFDKPRDIKVLVEGMKKCLEISSTKVMKKYGVRPFFNVFPGCETYKPYSDKYLECVAKSFTLTNYHPVGTCKMGDPQDHTSVVDPELKVKGVKSLRVIDASIMPKINTGHTEAPALMIGEKGSDLILKHARK